MMMFMNSFGMGLTFILGITVGLWLVHLLRPIATKKQIEDQHVYNARVEDRLCKYVANTERIAKVLEDTYMKRYG